MPSYNTIIVDDNELDLLHTQMHAKRYSFLNIVGSFNAAEPALIYLQNNKVDLLLLDIDMDEISGLDFKRQIGNEQTCIFITAYPDYAVESFEIAAFDFIVKPL